MPSEARTGVWGRILRKHHNLQASFVPQLKMGWGKFSLDSAGADSVIVRRAKRETFSLDSDGADPVTARRAKRENGGMGEDPPGSTT